MKKLIASITLLCLLLVTPVYSADDDEYWILIQADISPNAYSAGSYYDGTRPSAYLFKTKAVCLKALEQVSQVH